MSNSRGGLRSRWSQFDRAIRGLRGHSGGNTIFAELGHRDEWSLSLFVAAQVVECNVKSNSPEDLRLMGEVARLEYEAFALCVEATGSKPRLNIQ